MSCPPAGLPGRQELRSAGIPIQWGRVWHASNTPAHLGPPAFPHCWYPWEQVVSAMALPDLPALPGSLSLLLFRAPGPVLSPMTQPNPMLPLPLGAGPDTQGPGSLPPHTPQLALISLRDPRDPESFPCSPWSPAPRPYGSLCGCSGIPDSCLAGDSPQQSFSRALARDLTRGLPQATWAQPHRGGVLQAREQGQAQ